MAGATSTPETDIKVSLFGQTCLLSGPFNEKALTLIHSISPEKMPPLPTLEQARHALEKLKSIVSLPSALDNYRARLTKRLEAQVAIFEALATVKKSGKIDSLLAAVKTHAAKRSSELEALIRKLATKDTPSTWTATITNQITDSYAEAIEPHPEEEFHRAIRRVNVHYTCAFEENVPANSEVKGE